jgi:hypothetical protein
MAADSAGNDIGAVGIPLTGFLGFAPTGTTIPTPVEGADPELELDAAFVKAGLLKVDGGPQLAWAASGDPIEFWQDGYTIPSGLADVTLAAAFAQTDPFVRELVYGKVPDANGYLTVDGGGHSIEKIAYTEELFKNGAIRRRIADKVTVKSVQEDKSTRGEVLGYAVVFKISRSETFGMDHFGEWVLPAPSAAIPTISAATPSGKVAGDDVVITGTGFADATIVKFGAVAAIMFRRDSSTQITAIMPPGSAGSAAVKVTNPLGESAGFAYTRGA